LAICTALVDIIFHPGKAMMAFEKQVQAFASGTMTEYAFPAVLTAEERKTVKVTAEKLGLSSQSFGMGSERRIHIFKSTSEDNSCSSDTGSTAESESHDPIVEFISIKNSFVHFGESGATECRDPRIIQSMPNGKFAEGLKSDIAAAAELGSQKRRSVSVLLSDDEDAETEMSSEMLFPATPNAESPEMSFEVARNQASAVPTVQWMAPPVTTSELGTTTVLPPAMFQPQTVAAGLPPVTVAPSLPCTAVLPPATFVRDSNATASAQTVVTPESSTTVLAPATWSRESSTVVASPSFGTAPTQAPSSSISAVSMPMQPPPAFPAPGGSPCWMPGAPVILHGLANQPAFNGLHGTVSSFDSACGRYNISLEVAPNKQQMVKVKSQNLLPATQPSAQPFHKSSLTLDQML
jgi:hypothetical protein